MHLGTDIPHAANYCHYIAHNGKYTAEILIIGAGVAGLAAARELSKNFKNIILIEKNLNLGQEISQKCQVQAFTIQKNR